MWGIQVKWQGEGVDEVGINAENGQVIVKVNKKFFFIFNVILSKLFIAGLMGGYVHL